LVKRKNQDDPPAQTFLLGFDSQPILADKALYDLAQWSREQTALAEYLTQTPAEQVVAHLEDEAPAAGVANAVWQDWRARFNEHLAQFGNAIYNMDFVNAVPADAPAPILETLKFYMRGQGTSPYQRQQEAVERREQETQSVLNRVGPLRRAIFRKLLTWAQNSAPDRENGLATVGLGWPLLRRLLRELGRRLVEAGAIAQRDDVFWLEGAEVSQAATALDAGQTQLDSLSDLVAARKMQWRGRASVAPPQLLPKDSWMAKRYERLMPAHSTEQTGAVIKGIPVGEGKITAPARVLYGPEDFGTMQPGEVLVAGITTPAWTPLFALASAVVTDIGGPLSHSSIVAREYGIPAVLGTGVGTKRIQSGQMIAVDGDAGTVTLLDETGELMPE
jgi:pyruvate,water dikinase